MTQPLLSIQIPTVVGREKEYAFIEEVVRNQCVAIGEEPMYGWTDGPCEGMGGWGSKNIHFMYYRDNKELTIGEKRERMYARSRGLYSWQIDDDDSIDGRAIEKILAIIRAEKPDCITFKELCTINGKEFTSNHSLKYDDWGENQDGYDYVRTPYFKDVIRTDIAQTVPVPRIRYGEDHAWARALKPHLLTEHHIDEFIYFYNHNSTPHEQRYGIV